MIVGITGGIGSGKSTIAKAFACLGAPVYDSDREAKEILAKDSQVKEEVIQLLGEESYEASGFPNRPFIAEKIFNDAKLRKGINSIIHPAVARHFKAWVKSHHDKAYVIKEAALLIETGSYQDCDHLIVVFVPQELREKRVLQRDPQRGLSQVKEIIKGQIDPEEAKKFAHTWLINDNKNPLLPKLLALHQEWS